MKAVFEIETAHRTCWRFRKSADPHHSDTYIFNDHTLKNFAEKIRENERLRIKIQQAAFKEYSAERMDQIEQSVKKAVVLQEPVAYRVAVEVGPGRFMWNYTEYKVTDKNGNDLCDYQPLFVEPLPMNDRRLTISLKKQHISISEINDAPGRDGVENA